MKRSGARDLSPMTKTIQIAFIDPSTGDIVMGHAAVRGRMHAQARTGLPDARFVGAGLRRRDEGVTWARGWDTPEARALQAAAVLKR